MEIFLRGSWGTVGHDAANVVDAQVVCRQLGYDVHCKAPYPAIYNFIEITSLAFRYML